MEGANLSFFEQLSLFKEVFLKLLEKVDVVYIVPHKKMDFDALASSAALSILMKHLNKACYIVTDDDESMMEENIRSMYTALKYHNIFINSQFLDRMRTFGNTELLVVVDTNKEYLVPLCDLLPTFKNIVIIDHHNTDKHTINSDCYLINPDISSASEMVMALLKLFELKPNKYLAQCLLCGIYLDTGLLTRNFKKDTALTVAELIGLGADTNQVLSSFIISNFEADRERQRDINNLIDQTVYKQYGNCNFAVTFNSLDQYKVYTHEVLAQAADQLLKYKFDASFVIGYTDLACLGEGHQDIISIKGRSKSNFNVSELMAQFGGGGTIWSGACEIKGIDIIRIREVLFDTLEFSQNIQIEFHPKQLSLIPN